MKKLLLVFTGLICLTGSIYPCTTFLVSKDGKLAFGRNYDWLTGVGIVCTNLRGVAKTSVAEGGKTISWESQYGSITFNQYGKEFPIGGMNEKGLVVEIMWLDDTEYPEADARASLNVLQWVQYQLDNCATIEEAIATDSKVRIKQDNPTVHFLVADNSGHAATIEFLSGKMVVHRGKNLAFPVLTNTDYETSKNVMNKVRASGSGNQAPVLTDNSLQRFAQACSMISTYQQGDVKKPIVDFSFDVLNKVSVEGYTKWSIVYDITNKVIYFRTAKQASIKSVAFKDERLDCGSVARSLDMNQAMEGNVGKLFQPFSAEMNYRILRQSAQESRRRIKMNDADIRRLVDYASAVKCSRQ